MQALAADQIAIATGGAIPPPALHLLGVTTIALGGALGLQTIGDQFCRNNAGSRAPWIRAACDGDKLR